MNYLSNICDDCDYKSFCKYYKVIKRRKVSDFIFPEFITVIIEDKTAYIVDCDKFKSIYEVD
jgi:hypothetical protein